MKLFSPNKKRFRAAALMLVLFASLVSAPAAHASAWGEALAAALMKQALENIQRQIESAVLGTLKVAAVQVLNSQVAQLVGGNSVGQSLVISDFHQFLTTVPEQQAKLIIKDAFANGVLQGKASSSNYLPATQKISIEENYATILNSTVKASIDAELPRYDADECAGGRDPGQVLATSGDFKVLNCVTLNKANNPLGIQILAQEAQAAKTSQLSKEQEVLAQSSGFKPSMKDGKIVAPAGSIEELVTSVNSLGQNLITAANNPGELLSGVVIGLVNRTVNSLVQQGVGKVQSSIEREIRSVDNAVSGQIRSVTGQQGIGGVVRQANREFEQRTNVNQNTENPPLPPAFDDGIY